MKGASSETESNSATDADCIAPNVDWVQLEKHGCLAREEVCIDQVNLRNEKFEALAAGSSTVASLTRRAVLSIKTCS